MEQLLEDVGIRPAGQQPAWADVEQVRRIRAVLRSRPPLVRYEDIKALRAILARVAAGEAHVVQAGDCAEDVNECTPGNVARKVAVLDLLAGSLRMITGRPVVRIGRIAGQFAKPRSVRTERVGDQEIPAYFGDMVNGPEPDPDSRRPDPLRLFAGYMAANDIMEHLGWRDRGAAPAVDAPVWTSHEALLLDYEIPMVRGTDGRRYLGSTHLPWIGDRTRQPDGAHVALLAAVANPIGCKVGPTMTRDELLRLCEMLDPEREPGRLTLIARMGAGQVATKLPPLVSAVRAAGHPVIWLSDPMHGNTERAPCGAKTRVVGTVAAEVRRFCQVLTAAGGVAGGLHLETTPDDVTECVDDPVADGADVGRRYLSRCDPRLTARQAMSVVAAWAD